MVGALQLRQLMIRKFISVNYLIPAKNQMYNGNREDVWSEWGHIYFSSHGFQLGGHQGTKPRHIYTTMNNTSTVVLCISGPVPVWSDFGQRTGIYERSDNFEFVSTCTRRFLATLMTDDARKANEWGQPKQCVSSPKNVPKKNPFREFRFQKLTHFSLVSFSCKSYSSRTWQALLSESTWDTWIKSSVSFSQRSCRRI